MSTNWKALQQSLKAKTASKFANINQTASKVVEQKEIKSSDARGSLKRRNCHTSDSILDLFEDANLKDVKNKEAIGKFLSIAYDADRVVIVNYWGIVVFDQRILSDLLIESSTKPSESSTKLRLDSQHDAQHQCYQEEIMQKKKNFSNQIQELLQNRILIGHGLRDLLRKLNLQCPRSHCRDTLLYPPFHDLFNTNSIDQSSSDSKRKQRRKSWKHSSSKSMQSEIKLEDLVLKAMSVSCTLNSVLDKARVCMLLYRNNKKEWENRVFHHQPY